MNIPLERRWNISRKIDRFPKENTDFPKDKEIINRLCRIKRNVFKSPTLPKASSKYCRIMKEIKFFVPGVLCIEQVHLRRQYGDNGIGIHANFQSAI